MPEINSQTLSGVAETLLIPLYNRAMESQRPDAIMKDAKAVALVEKMRSDKTIHYDFDQVRKIRMHEGNKVARIMLTREMDRYARDFLSRHPEAVIVHIGCGLDSRFERADNGRVEWYDLDLPEVIELRRKLIGGEGERYHLLGCSGCASISRVQSWSSTAGRLSSSGWVTASSPVQSLPASYSGDFGAARQSKAGVGASRCWVSGVSSTNLSRGCTLIAGLPTSFACSNHCAFSTSSLERQRNEKTFSMKTSGKVMKGVTRCVLN